MKHAQDPFAPSPIFSRKGLFVVHRVMIVHESWLMREILKSELVKCHCHVVYCASTCLDARIAYRLHKPDIVFVDTTQNANRGQQTIQNILDLDNTAAVIALVHPDGDTAALHALVSGARGFLTISSPADVIQQELNRIAEVNPQSQIIAKTMDMPIAVRIRSVLRMLSGWRTWSRRGVTESL
jgi:DNA-binding NarL/FixJ family response regulator